MKNSGNVGIGTASPNTKLAVDGLTGTSSFNDVKVNTATGDFYYQTSSLRYKEDIQDLNIDFQKILDVKPKIYIDKSSGQNEIGYIAEEFDQIGLSNLVIYNQENEPDGLKYERVSIYLIEIIKEQQKRIEALERKFNSLTLKEID